LNVTAVIPKTLAQQLGGTGIGGYMNTALANSNGELVIPLIVTGTFDSPKFLPDVKRMAQMKLKGVLPSFDNPAGGILGGLLGGKSGDNAQEGGKTSNPVGDILGGFLGRKKKAEAPAK
jgi:hypothetical protein